MRVLTMDPETYEMLEDASLTFGLGGAHHIDEATGYVSVLIDSDVAGALEKIDPDLCAAVRILLARNREK